MFSMSDIKYFLNTERETETVPEEKSGKYTRNNVYAVTVAASGSNFIFILKNQ